IEATSAIGRSHDTEPLAMIAPGGIGGEANAWLMAQRIERQNPRILNDLEERQDKIARNTEDLMCAMILQRLQQYFSELHWQFLAFGSKPHYTWDVQHRLQQFLPAQGQHRVNQ